jgi:glycosyltransferase involved in cell wall biosynthesis
MVQRLVATVRFFFDVSRDVVGTFRQRWLRFQKRVAEAEDIATVAVDIFPFLERKTGVGWYEWCLLEALDTRQDGLTFNLYARTFPLVTEPVPTETPGSERMRLRVHPIPHGFLLPQRPIRWLLQTLVEPLLRILDGNDVVFAPNYYAHPDQVPYGRTTVNTIHDLTYVTMPEAVRPSTHEELRRNMPRALYHADRLIAVSAATASDIVEHLPVSPRKVHVVHEGRDPLFNAATEASSRPIDLPDRFLLFVSTIEPRKNVVGLLKAFGLLVEWGYPGSLLLVGQWGWRTEAIRKALEEGGIEDRIIHLDYVERDRLVELYRHADALLYPSWLEGFGLPILEAMACGTPVVTSGISSMPEVAGPAAVYVDPASPHGIASSVASLVNDESNRQRLARLGLERSTRFTWDGAAAATAQILRIAAGLPATGDDEYRV